MDGLTLAAAVSELGVLIDGKIDRIQQPGRDELIITVRSYGSAYRLLLSSSAENSRVQLTSQRPENPAEPPMFCMLLRKHLTGGRILSVDQPNFDRIVVFRVSTYNDLGDSAVNKLVCEVMGKHSNIMLVNEKGTILDSIKRVDLSMSAVRPIMPGVVYSIPKTQEKLDPRHAAYNDFMAAVEAEGRLDKKLSGSFYGLSPDMAKLLSNYIGVSKDRCEMLEDTEKHRLCSGLVGFYADVNAGKFTPAAVCGPGGAVKAVYPFPPSHLETVDYPSVWEALDSMYSNRDVADRLRQRYLSLQKLIQNAIARCERKLNMLSEECPSEDELERMRLNGELITANLYRINKGMTEFVAENYYCDPPSKTIITLDPKLSPSENAQLYYKRYRKGQRAREKSCEQMRETSHELAYLEGQLDNLAKCEVQSDIEEIREEMVALRYIRKSSVKKSRKVKPTVSNPMRFVSSDGIELMVGKNNRQNDMLTLRMARPNDWWFHAKDIPGSHVVAQHTGELPRQTLFEAALLASYYSRSRTGENVPVDYTLKRFVKKPAGAKPGMVIYTDQKTIYVTPDEQTVLKLLDNAKNS